MKTAAIFAFILCPVLGAGCGPSVASSTRPKPMTASAALGDEAASEPGVCRDVKEGGRPLVVDWKPEQRGDLEVAMKSGIAVMSYDCQKMTLLADCRVEGTYGFKGVVFKQQLIRLVDQDEIRANLPFSGTALAARLSAELERGATLDLATALVGNLTGSRVTVDRSELSGRCDGATHFVRGANVGAFVMQSGERAQLATAAGLFGASADAGSTSSRFARVEDGSVDACKAASADSANPPNNCGALVRVHLLPIDESAAPPAPATPEAETQAREAKLETTCPEGLVLQEGKCTKPATQAAHECRADDVDDCRTQCDKGQPASCARFARLIAKGKAGEPDTAKTAQLYRVACDADLGDACSDLGIQYFTGKGVSADPIRAVQLFEKACKLGEANGCFNLGNVYYDGEGIPKDRAKAFALFEQSCNAGKPAGCINVGNMYDDGDGVAADSAKAFALFKRACEGGAALGCSNLAYMYAEGKSVTKDQAAALGLYEKACTLGNARGCEYAGTRYAKGDGVAADAAKGNDLLKRACDLGAAAVCKKVTAAAPQ
nr:hypothetical protein [uncultured bacterium]